MKYLRKPCEAEAIQWLSTNFNEIKEMIGDDVKLEGESLLVKIDGAWTPAYYGVYIVKENDTIFSISNLYGIPPIEIIRTTL